MKIERSRNLAQAVHQDDPGAVEELVRTYQGRLFGYAHRLLQNRFDAQEVTQDALLRAYRCLAFQYDEEKCRALALGPWLFRITRNLVLNRLRHRHSRREEPLPDPGGEQEEPFRHVSEPSMKLQSLERQASLEHALRSLSSENRDLILLRFVEGMAYSEIATVTRMTESAARGKVFRALRRLRALLEVNDEM